MRQLSGQRSVSDGDRKDNDRVCFVYESAASKLIVKQMPSRQNMSPLPGPQAENIPPNPSSGLYQYGMIPPQVYHQPGYPSYPMYGSNQYSDPIYAQPSMMMRPPSRRQTEQDGILVVYTFLLRKLSNLILANRFANVMLESLANEIYSLCKDQHGCRYLQKKLEEHNPTYLNMIFSETYPHVVELMTGIYTYISLIYCLI